MIIRLGTEVPIEIHDGNVLLGTVLIEQAQDGGPWDVLGTEDFIGSATVVIVTEVCS